MKILLLISLILANLSAQIDIFSKDIIIENITKPTLIRVKIDKDIYAYSKKDYGDIRIYNQDIEIGYFIEKDREKRVIKEKTLKASYYDRENRTLKFIFDKPFLVDEIKLGIKNSNFQTVVQLYIDGLATQKEQKIYDYSQETGNRNFNIKINQQMAKEIVLDYDKSSFFSLEKNELYRETTHLEIPFVTFLNHTRSKIKFDSSSINILSQENIENRTEYIFDIKNIDIHNIIVEAKEDNYKRRGYIYLSQDNKIWRFFRTFNIAKSSFGSDKKDKIDLDIRAKFIKLRIENRDNQALTIESIKIDSAPSYIYFIANPNSKYSLSFGDKNRKKAFYDIESILDKNISFQDAKLDALQTEKAEISDQNFLENHKSELFILMMLFAVGVLFYIAFLLLQSKE